VKEWCINSAAVDPATDSVLAGSEDGKLYRWDLATNTFSQSMVLTSGLGEAYTPTLIGPDGTVYAINNATLFAVGR
jgi:WD40 repeat protein